MTIDTRLVRGLETDEIKEASVYNNHFAKIKDQYMVHPIRGGDGRVLVSEDPFKSKYDCSECGGKGHTSVKCPHCKGTKYHNTKESNGECPDCTVGTSDGRTTYGYVLCPKCSGKGGTIIIPDESKRNTTTGTVLAVSYEGIMEVKVGDKLLYTSYTGTPFNFCDCDLRVMVEKDAIAILKQLKTNVDSIEQRSYADLQNTGTPHEE